MEESEAHYLSSEPEAEHKREYRKGQIVPMDPVSPAHSLIQVNLACVIGNALKDTPCYLFSSQTRIKVASARFYTYPDLSATCAEPLFDALDPVALINPGLIIEVLSPSTEAYDRGLKFEFYRQLASLREYVLVRQDSMHVEVRTQQADGSWQTRVYESSGDTIELTAVPARFPLDDVYLKVF